MTLDAWVEHFRRELDDEWSERIPGATECALRLALQWGIEPVEGLPGATCSLLFAGRRADGVEVVLRFPLAEEEAGPGYRTMIAFADFGGVSVLGRDPETGTTLMPRLRPGGNLAESALDESDQIRVATHLFRCLQAAPIADAWSHERWFQELWSFELRADAPVSSKLVDFAKELGRHLLDTTTRTTLLHGDLHHYNILGHGETWVIIDPKGVVGDPAFEPVAFLRNPVDALPLDPDLVGRQRNRIERFAELLDEPIERIWGWAIAQIVLDAAWAKGAWSKSWGTVAKATFQACPAEARCYAPPKLEN